MKWPAWVSHSRTIHVSRQHGLKEGALESACFLGAEALVKRYPGTWKLECGELVRQHNLFLASSNQCISEFQLFQPKITTLLSQDTSNSRLSSYFHHLGPSVRNFSSGEKNQLEMVSESCSSQWKEGIKIKGPPQLLKQTKCKFILARRRGIVWSDVVSAGFQKDVLLSRPSNRDVSLFQQDIESGHCESKSHWVVYWFKALLFVSSFSPVNLELQEWSRLWVVSPVRRYWWVYAPLVVSLLLSCPPLPKQKDDTRIWAVLLWDKSFPSVQDHRGLCRQLSIDLVVPLFPQLLLILSCSTFRILHIHAYCNRSTPGSPFCCISRTGFQQPYCTSKIQWPGQELCSFQARSWYVFSILSGTSDKLLLPLYVLFLMSRKPFIFPSSNIPFQFH